MNSQVVAPAGAQKIGPAINPAETAAAARQESEGGIPDIKWHLVRKGPADFPIGEKGEKPPRQFNFGFINPNAMADFYGGAVA